MSKLIVLGAVAMIRLKVGAEPVALHQPIPLPHHWHQELLDGLERDCRLGVIRKVPAGLQQHGLQGWW